MLKHDINGKVLAKSMKTIEQLGLSSRGPLNMIDKQVGGRVDGAKASSATIGHDEDSSHGVIFEDLEDGKAIRRVLVAFLLASDFADSDRGSRASRRIDAKDGIEF